MALTAKQELALRFASKNVSSIEDGTEFIKNLGTEMERGFAEVDNAVAQIRACEEPNPWKDRSDEEICAEILRRIVVPVRMG